MRFVASVSKGSRFNQIYVPRSAEGFEAGDVVEVRLLQKRTRLFYSKGLKRLGRFKEKLIEDVFSFLERFEDMRQVFVVGSFLTSADYNDIDILLSAERKHEKMEGLVHERLTGAFGMKFHVICMPESRLAYLMESCPLTRSMLYYHVSDKPLRPAPGRKVDANHIRFLLMMPEDVLEVDVGSRAFYDSLRRLLTIEKFLKNKSEDPLAVNSELEKILGSALFEQLKNGETMDAKAVKKARTLIAAELKKIKRLIENGQDKNRA